MNHPLGRGTMGKAEPARLLFEPLLFASRHSIGSICCPHPGQAGSEHVCNVCPNQSAPVETDQMVSFTAQLAISLISQPGQASDFGVAFEQMGGRLREGGQALGPGSLVEMTYAWVELISPEKFSFNVRYKSQVCTNGRKNQSRSDLRMLDAQANRTFSLLREHPNEIAT